ncbi:hypothetical protein NOCARDAX2BIS_180031 [Nocardioides sp. AX2bis]|nr:hypothetical protein NOCARDAX2BIS_180031 [Nocardioides sp. AX2bis]
MAVPAGPRAAPGGAAVRLPRRRGRLPGRWFHAGVRLGAHLRRRQPPLRQGGVRAGAARVRRVVPRGGPHARGPAGHRPGSRAAVGPRGRRVGRAGPRARRGPAAGPAVGRRGPGPLRRRAHADRRGADPRARGAGGKVRPGHAGRRPRGRTGVLAPAAGRRGRVPAAGRAPRAGRPARRGLRRGHGRLDRGPHRGPGRQPAPRRRRPDPGLRLGLARDRGRLGRHRAADDRPPRRRPGRRRGPGPWAPDPRRATRRRRRAARARHRHVPALGDAAGADHLAARPRGAAVAGRGLLDLALRAPGLAVSRRCPGWRGP